MKKYFAVFKISFIGALVHRFHLIAMFMTNMAFITLTYFLWKAIFEGSHGSIAGMNLNQTFIYLSVSSSVFFMFQSWVEFDLARAIISGNIAVDISKPYSLQFYWLFRIIGFIACKSITVALPSILVIVFVFNAGISPGINMAYFAISLALAFLISFHIDFILGLVSFYIEAVWGLSMIKETVVLLLSGAIVPIAFFPHGLAAVVKFLPFQAIYNTPMSILVSDKLDLNNILSGLLVQMVWVLTLGIGGNLLYRKFVRQTVINGG